MAQSSSHKCKMQSLVIKIIIEKDAEKNNMKKIEEMLEHTTIFNLDPELLELG